VSLSSAEEPADPADDQDSPSISATGRFVLWESDADNLVPNDGNNNDDLFLRDRKRGRTSRVSLTSSEGEIDGIGYPSMSYNARYIAFESNDNTVVPGDGNQYSDVFVRDRRRGTTKRASLFRNGTEPNDFAGYAQISPDGRFVTFCSPATNVDADYPDDDVFVRDMVRRKTRLISVGANEGNPAANGNCYSDVSTDGHWVAWVSGAVSLVLDDTNGVDDIYFRGPYR
jgi:Tol biopolymer transport system component